MLAYLAAHDEWLGPSHQFTVVSENRMANDTRLNSAMQAVEVHLEIDGHPVKAVIPREVFERCLKSAPTPEAWLQSYGENTSMLNTAICRRFAAKPQDFVVVRSSDFANSDGGRY